MFAEALEFLADKAVLAREPKKLTTGDHADQYLIDGVVKEVAKEAPARKHHVESVADVIALATRFADATPVAWFDFNRVALVIDDADHRVDMATLDLKPSETFTLLCKLRSSPTWFDQEGFIRLLRVDLAGSMPSESLLNVVRYLKFENGVIAKSDVRHGKRSYDSAVVSKVESDVEIPEEVGVNVRIWTNQGEDERLVIRCAVDIRPKEGKLQLIPLPDEIERVKNLAIVGLAGRLRDGLGDVPSYFGRP